MPHEVVHQKKLYLEEGIVQQKMITTHAERRGAWKKILYPEEGIVQQKLIRTHAVRRGATINPCILMRAAKIKYSSIEVN